MQIARWGGVYPRHRHHKCSFERCSNFFVNRRRQIDYVCCSFERMGWFSKSFGCFTRQVIHQNRWQNPTFDFTKKCFWRQRWRSWILQFKSYRFVRQQEILARIQFQQLFWAIHHSCRGCFVQRWNEQNICQRNAALKNKVHKFRKMLGCKKRGKILFESFFVFYSNVKEVKRIFL